MNDDEHLKVVLRQALDAALQAHVQTLFAVMMKDPTNQPERALAGARKAIAAHQQALAALEEVFQHE